MTGRPDLAFAALKEAVIRVGDGRGFIVEHGHDVLVITAGHCLRKTATGQQFPPPKRVSSPEDRTYPNLLGPLGMRPSLCAECLFLDPIADLAVVCEPDAQFATDQKTRSTG